MESFELKKFSMTESDEHFNVFTQMCYAYFAEMSQYSERLKNIILRNKKTDEDFFVSIFSNEVESYMILNDCNLIGFVIVGIENNKHHECDLFISELYIEKQYRRNGFGEKAVREIIDKYKGEKFGRTCLLILKDNRDASKFWMKVFNKMSYNDISTKYRKDILCLPQECESYIFEPSMVYS